MPKNLPTPHKCVPPGVVHITLIESEGPYFVDGDSPFRQGEYWVCDGWSLGMETRADCKILYRLDLRCLTCLHFGSPHSGPHTPGLEWYKATYWQRFTYWLKKKMR